MIGLRSGSLLNKKREKKIGHIMMENFGTLIRYKKKLHQGNLSVIFIRRNLHYVFWAWFSNKVLYI